MAKAEGDHATFEFDDDVANEFKSITNTTNLHFSPRCSIFKVPNILKRHNPKAYEPNAFSIGPYHYGEERLKATQKIKLKYLQELIDRLQGTISVSTLIEDIGKLQQEARECYAEPFDDRISNDGEFVKILVLDGCFLIELFLKNAYKDHSKDDPIFTMSCMQQFLSHDLILLENQIPWLVLERLFDITKNTDNLDYPLSILAMNYCNSLGFCEDIIKLFLDGRIKSRHILDLLRNAMVTKSIIPDEKSSKCQCMPLTTKLKEAAGNEIKDVRLCLSPNHPHSSEDKNIEWKGMPSAARLRDAGIKFKKGTSSTSILDIKFEDGDLKIPKLIIQDNTESLLRNLICLEKCLPDCVPQVTCYAMLLDNLINTAEDMEILCESGIIDNWLDIDVATKICNQLCHDVFVCEFVYFRRVNDVDKYCHRPWPIYRARLMRDYVRPYLTAHPWACVSVTAATILLVLTFLQTFFTIKN